MERTDLPDDLIRTVSGAEVFKAEEQRVHPILGFPDRLVSQSSQELVQKHAQEWPTERIFRQVPAAEGGSWGGIAQRWTEKWDACYDARGVVLLAMSEHVFI